MNRLRAEGIDWRQRARALALFTVAYNILEALACAWFGIEAESRAILGFGGDSLIEAASGALIWWRFSQVGDSPKNEILVHLWISNLLLALAVFLAVSASLDLYHGHRPQSTMAGSVIALLSLLVMGWLYRSKMSCARALKSDALRADAICTLSCMWLSGLLLLGSLFYEFAGWAWVDAITTLGMAILIAREGAEEHDESLEELSAYSITINRQPS